MCGDVPHEVHRITNRKVKMSLVNALIKEGVLHKKAVYTCICNICLKYSEDNLCQHTGVVEENVCRTCVMETINILDTNDITNNEIRLLTYALGRNMSKQEAHGP